MVCIVVCGLLACPSLLDNFAIFTYEYFFFTFIVHLLVLGILLRILRLSDK